MNLMDDFEVDWNKVEIKNYEPLPAGVYGAKMIVSKLTKTKDGKGKKLEVTFEILGQKKDSKLYDNWNVKNKSVKATQIGQARLKAMAIALEMNIEEVKDTSEFHGKPVGLKLKIEKSEEYGDKNKIVAILPFSEDMLDDGSDTTSEIAVEEPEIIEDVVAEEIVEEVIEEAVVVEEGTPTGADLDISPVEINAMKAPELKAYVLDNKLGIIMKGMKVGDLKEAIIDLLFGTVVEDDEIIIED